MPRPIREHITLADGTIHLPVGTDKFAIIDACDAFEVLQHGWALKDTNSRRQSLSGDYAHAKVKGRTVSLHRFILKAVTGQIIDHINGNGLDNRRCNLRFVTAAQNLANRRKGRGALTSVYKGVHKRENGRWRASVRVNRKLHSLGTFLTEKEAALAYNKAALAFFGVHARINDL